MRTLFITLGGITGLVSTYLAWAFVAQDYWWAFQNTDDHFFARVMFILFGGVFTLLGAVVAAESYDWNN